jgi:hypothetical protein
MVIEAQGRPEEVRVLAGIASRLMPVSTVPARTDIIEIRETVRGKIVRVRPASFPRWTRPQGPTIPGRVGETIRHA